MTYKKARTYADMERDPRVDWISDERGTGEGIWVYLKEGYINDHLECGTIHEHTVAECCLQLNTQVTQTPSS
jgi:hypothetical protein|tara:strand:- start:345 stop:560 length:216 start_codon:yes stop_codon:yes gene_type:complete